MSARGRGAWLAGAGLLLLALALAIALQVRRGSVPADAIAPAPGPRPAPAAPIPAAEVAPAPFPSAPLPAPALPLPPVDAPLADVAEQLRARADAGDSLAACRLALELLRCEELEQALATDAPTIADGATALPREQEDALRDRLDYQRIWQLQRLQDCRATPGHLRKDPRRYLLQAARAGEPEAMRRYAYGELVIVDGNDFLAGAGFDDWRRDAPAMALAALRAGDPAAAHLLQLAYAGDNMPLDGLIADDPLQALAYQLLWRRLRGQAVAADGIDPRLYTRADALATRWHDDYFAGRRVDDATAVFNAPLMHDDAGGQSRELCARGR